MPEQFWSEDGVDQWIADNLRLPQKGFYVDVGCAHPDRYSNTAFLRGRGWSGLAIDGTPEYEPEWRGIEGATFLNAVIALDAQVPFLNEKTNALVSRIHQEGTLTPARRLTDILRNKPHVDLMSLDVEGSEIEIIQDLVSENMLPTILIAEYNSCHRGRDPLLIEQIIRAGFDFVHMTDSNGVFTSPKRSWPFS